jgi:RNA polymerase sigma-70 factor (ECF subfamily)
VATSASESEATVRWLILQIQAGVQREENFKRLYHLTSPRVASFFRRKGLSVQDSQDLTQDVFLRVCRGIDAFRHESLFERWLVEIARHVFSNYVRSLKTEKRDAPETPLDAYAEDSDETSASEAFNITDPSPSALDQVIRRQQSLALREALSELPNQMRACCSLRYSRGLKYEEIAAIMKISIETVKAHIYQGSKRLSVRMQASRSGAG